MKPRKWLDLAENDINFCKLIEEQLPSESAQNGICFHIQQAVEKLLKGILSANGKEVKCTDIYNLAEMCEDFTDVELPAELTGISNTLTAWGNTFELPKFNKDIYDTAQNVIVSLSDILNNEIDRTETMTDKLEYIIGQEYAEMHENWLKMSPEELIDKSDVISAAKFAKDHISDSFSEEEAEYLLQFKHPLEILVDKISALNDPDNIAVREQFSDIVSDMYDKQDEYADYELVDESETDGMTMQ